MQMKPGKSTWRLMVGATGVVFGDVGTSPLYAFRESFIGHHPLPIDETHVLGVLSMLLWTLILVVTIKYVFVTMHADNNGEGGSFALLAFVEREAGGSRALPWIAMAALLASGLFYGDAIIAPAISILSAVEGLTLLEPGLESYVLPVTSLLVLALFAAQRHGTGAIGGLFGPIMLIWFATIGVLGAMSVAANPVVLSAIDPRHALGFVVTDPARAFFTLGTVVLAVTGAEALYADMGHFGRRPIARAWLWFALPELMLCYAGQSALVLHDPGAIRSPFYLLAPAAVLTPLLVLATAATIIASQSIISGAFSVTQQAVQLGYLPGVKIVHTSEKARGQVYAPAVNGLLMIAAIGLVLVFRSSTALAAAFGLAATATMLLTTLIIGFVIFRIWRWHPLFAVPLYAVLLALDLGLFAASATKLRDGGWLPLTIALLVVLWFDTWRRGRTLLAEHSLEDTMSIVSLLAASRDVRRVPATAIYLSSSKEGVPRALLHNLKANHVMHERILLVTVETTLTPRVDPQARLTEITLGAGITRVIVRYGFSENPDVPAALATLGKPFNPMSATYFLSRQTLVPAEERGLAQWRERLFALMMRLSRGPQSYFKLPVNSVVELGSQVEI